VLQGTAQAVWPSPVYLVRLPNHDVLAVGTECCMPLHAACVLPFPAEQDCGRVGLHACLDWQHNGSTESKRSPLVLSTCCSACSPGAGQYLTYSVALDPAVVQAWVDGGANYGMMFL
jgi:hypothetical protein